MLRVQKILPLVLVALLVTAPLPSHAALIPTYDVDSLCYMSTDVVEAALNWHQEAGQSLWQHTISATVLDSIAGQYHPGDVIPALKVDSRDPAVIGRHCIVFISRRRFTFYLQPSEAIAPSVTDVLLVDRRGHVRRYFQWGDPGGFVAEGFTPPGDAEDDSAEQSYPTLAQERKIIAARWSAVDRLRPLLSHDPRPEDVPVLLSLLRERQHPREFHSKTHFLNNVLSDIIAKTICSRLVDNGDPSVALDALSLTLDSGAGIGSSLFYTPFRTASGMAYARSVVQDRNEPAARRDAAAEVIRRNSE